jgi:hypothetical protein
MIGERVYTVVDGFRTDGASIPYWLRPLCGSPCKAPRLYAALLHDWFYAGGDSHVTRGQADAIYRDMQIALGVSRVNAWVEWSALRIAGASHWRTAAAALALALPLAGCQSDRLCFVDGLLLRATNASICVGYGRYLALPPGATFTYTGGTNVNTVTASAVHPPAAREEAE